MVGCGVWLLPLGFLKTSRLVDDNSWAEKTVGGWSAETIQLIALLCFTSSISCLGLVTVGSMKSATLVARNFSHFVFAVVQLLVCVGMLLIPLLVNWLAPNNSIAEWRSVFIVVCLILFGTNLIFCRLCSAEAAPWAVNAAATSTQASSATKLPATAAVIVNVGKEEERHTDENTVTAKLLPAI